MTINITTVTGEAVTGLTNPGYTFAADVANGTEKSFICTALTGTQTGVTPHSVSSPFRIVSRKIKNPKSAGSLQGNGVFRFPGKNYHSLSLTKGAIPQLNQQPQMCTFDGKIGIPAGADVYDKANVAAFYSALAGMFSNLAQGLYDVGTANTQ